jgi:hypothetical protein
LLTTVEVLMYLSSVMARHIFLFFSLLLAYIPKRVLLNENKSD